MAGKAISQVSTALSNTHELCAMPLKPPVATTPQVPYVRDCFRCSHPVAPIVCKRCQCVSYCSDDHQKADTQRHRKQCKPVADARKALEIAEKELLKEEPHVFDSADGWFYLIYETRPYVRAKYALIAALAEAGTFLSTEQALKEAKEHLFLNQGDNLAVREVVPALLLLLGRMQEAYDFIRFWATHDDSEEGEGEENEGEDDDGDDEDDEDEEMIEIDVEQEPQPPGKRGKGKTTPFVRTEVNGVAPCFKNSGADMTESLDVFLKPRVDSVFFKCALTYIKSVIAHALLGAIRKLSNGDEAEKTEVLAFLTQNNLPTQLGALRELYTKIFDQAVQAFRLTHEKNGHLWGPMTSKQSKGTLTFRAAAHPKANQWFMERSQWQGVYSDLWGAEGYKLHFLFSALMSRDEEPDNLMSSLFGNMIRDYALPGVE